MKTEGPLRIMVADSGLVSRSALTALLASRVSWQVCGVASSGEEAVEKAGRLKPHVIVLDGDLPRTGGLEAGRRIIEIDPGQKFIVLTDSVQPAVLKKIFDSGAHGFLLKADATRDLVPAIDRIVGGRTCYSAKGAELVLRECLKPGSVEESITDRQREVLSLLGAEFSSNFGWAYPSRIPGPRFHYKLIAALAMLGLLTLCLVYAQDPAFADRSLTALGLKSDSPHQFDGNPQTKVWIELRTALYHCPGEDRYAAGSTGRFETQRQAQLDHFEPAAGKVCK